VSQALHPAMTMGKVILWFFSPP